MKKLLLIFCTAISVFAHAQLTSQQQAALQQAEKNMTPAQRRQVEQAVGLNLLSGLMTDPDVVIKNVNQNKASAEDKMALMKRIQAHQNNPSYFQTPQGKADLKAMQSQYSQVGGNIANASNIYKKFRSRYCR
ncbi:MAG: hypothetical protein PW786_07230 [Arachidicoccus sp.]|nr:hypothetical protein [Arachidicoccus sp.]